MPSSVSPGEDRDELSHLRTLVSLERVLAAWSIKSSRCPSNSSISCSLSLGNGSLIDSSSGLIRSWATPGRPFR